MLGVGEKATTLIWRQKCCERDSGVVVKETHRKSVVFSMQERSSGKRQERRKLFLDTCCSWPCTFLRLKTTGEVEPGMCVRPRPHQFLSQGLHAQGPACGAGVDQSPQCQFPSVRSVQGPGWGPCQSSPYRTWGSQRLRGLQQRTDPAWSHRSLQKVLLDLRQPPFLPCCSIDE